MDKGSVGVQSAGILFGLEPRVAVGSQRTAEIVTLAPDWADGPKVEKAGCSRWRALGWAVFGQHRPRFILFICLVLPRQNVSELFL